jgi:hypothetical protein
MWRMSVSPLAAVGAILIGLGKPMFAGFALMLIPIKHRVIAAKFNKPSGSPELTTSELTEQN